MHTLLQTIRTAFEQWRESGVLHVVYALAAETLILGFLGFMGLFTIETILPTFVSVRLSLTKLFFALTLCAFLLALLGRFLDMRFLLPDNKKNPIIWIGIAWTIGILVLSLYKFPPVTIPVIILGFLAVGALFWKILFGEKE